MYKYIAVLHASVALQLVANLTVSNSMTSTNALIMPVSVRTATSASSYCTTSSLYHCIERVIKLEREPLLLH